MATSRATCKPWGNARPTHGSPKAQLDSQSGIEGGVLTQPCSEPCLLPACVYRFTNSSDVQLSTLAFLTYAFRVSSSLSGSYELRLSVTAVSAQTGHDIKRNGACIHSRQSSLVDLVAVLQHACQHHYRGAIIEDIQ